MSARILLLSSGFWIVACDGESRKEPSPAAEQVGGTSATEPAAEDPEGQISELRSKIESGRRQIDDIEAFAEMERSKVEEDPDYDQSFLLEALDEQLEIRKEVESGERRLRELTRPEG